MVNTNPTEIDGLGPVLFEHSKRAKHINISIKPFKGVRVAVPYGSSFKNAAKFVRAKSDWIKTHIEKIRQYERECNSNLDAADDVDKEKVKTILTRKLIRLSRNFGFTYNKVYIRNQKTRWGSCSSKNNISLNLKLVRLPDELIDYVIIHELVHTRIKDHSRSFWAEVDKLTGNGKEMASKLKTYGITLY